MTTAEKERQAELLAGRVADRAAELADEFLERGRADIAAMAEDDYRVLFRAAQLVRARLSARVTRPAASPEHLAFSLIIAASDLQKQRRMGDGDQI